MNNLALRILPLVLLFILTNCKTEPKTKKTRITLNIAKTDIKKIDLTAINLLGNDSELIATNNLDSTGTATLEFDLEKPIFGWLRVASDGSLRIYLSPGDHLKIIEDQNVEGKKVKYEGIGGLENTYLRNFDDIRFKYEGLNGAGFKDLNPDQFKARFDSLSMEYGNLFATLKKRSDVRKEAIAIFESRIPIILIAIQQNYTSQNYDYDISNSEIPAFLKKSMVDIPIDTIALNSNNFEYELMLSQFVRYIVHERIYDRYKELRADSLKKLIPSASEDLIIEKNYPKGIEEFLLACNLLDLLNQNGITPELEIIYEKFLKQAENPRSLMAVKQAYNNWLPLEAGKQAPEFTGLTKEGKCVSLSDFRGKIVYVDLWATWCGPCVGEFPKSRELIKHYEKDDRIVFLFVSSDSDIKPWKRMVSSTDIPKGIHINISDKDRQQALMNLYNVNGIPRYILIDTQGNIINAHALRPSSSKIIPQLNKALSPNLVEVQ